MESVQIQHYVLLHKNETSDVYKKNIKKLSKKQLFKRLDIKLVKTDNESELKSIKEYLVNIKKMFPKEVGVLLDSNIILHDITYIPNMPKQYDILCLESNIKSYLNDNKESIYWCPVNIISSGNFIINGSSIQKVINIINKCENMNDFYNELNGMNTYTITQTQFSQKMSNYVHDPYVINNNLTENDILNYDKKLSLEFYNKFENTTINKINVHNKIIKNELLPKISLICPVTDKTLFFHNLLTFLKLDYPRHLLELVIINDFCDEKDLNLPEDARIKLINISNKNNNEKMRLQLGYKLNIGVKHATNNIIMHFFDTSNYNLTMKQTISTFLLSNKNSMISNDTGIYNKSVINIPDIANCIYTKDFWKNMSFEEHSHNLYSNIDLLFKWLSFRTNEVVFLPFLYISFRLKNDKKRILYEKVKNLEFDLSLLVDKKIKESFDLLEKS